MRHSSATHRPCKPLSRTTGEQPPSACRTPFDAHDQSQIQPATSSPSTASNEPATMASIFSFVRHLLDPAQIADHEPPSDAVQHQWPTDP
ncbi:hypothetical protein ACLOJK_027155 [Asimina triloba]